MNSNNTKKHKKPTKKIKSNGHNKNGKSSNGNGIVKDKLNEKQKLFVEEYLIDFNATQAAVRAGYTPSSADTTGYRLTRNKVIQELVQARSKELLEDRSALAAKTIRHLEAVADSDIFRYIMIGSNNRQITQLRDLSQVDTRAIASVEVNEKVERDRQGHVTNISDRVVKVKLWDKTRSLETLSKVTGLSEIKLTGGINLNFDLEGFKNKIKLLLLGDAPADDSE